MLHGQRFNFDNRRRRAQLQLVQHPDSRIPSHPTHTHLGERSIITNHLSIASDHRLQPEHYLRQIVHSPAFHLPRAAATTCRPTEGP
ncbi:uncharacterized protein QC761_0014780 [Podospora bellae-mahoneyi]|uniref:Uncharacterized protein n=1 Tax=Podospora bellae-mahoneyi TaxID=2093777 RepID=A0ABR0FZA9_9PEZI|nr:hypothetical protein QC761_0014780 [Podospora bellae-mahoneyi]